MSSLDAAKAGKVSSSTAAPSPLPETSIETQRLAEELAEPVRGIPGSSFSPSRFAISVRSRLPHGQCRTGTPKELVQPPGRPPYLLIAPDQPSRDAWLQALTLAAASEKVDTEVPWTTTEEEMDE